MPNPIGCHGLSYLTHLLRCEVKFLLMGRLWHCANTHLKAPDQQTDKSSAFTEVLFMSSGGDLSFFYLALLAQTQPFLHYTNSVINNCLIVQPYYIFF